MIPGHLINKALDAWIGDHNCPHPDQISVYRVLITRSLEAVAADIWDEGEASVGMTMEDWEPRLTYESNPYKASEDA